MQLRIEQVRVLEPTTESASVTSPVTEPRSKGPSVSERRTASARRTAARTIALASSGVLLALALPATAATAAPGTACDVRDNNTYAKLLECVTLEGVREHQAAFQAISDESTDPVYPKSRAAGTDGYADSVAYVKGLLEDAGYTVTLDPVQFRFSFPPLLRQTAPVQGDYQTLAFSGSGSGRVEGGVIPVDLSIADPAASTSGCEAGDFAALDFSGPNDIALLQRGTCTFGLKAVNAQAAGAEAVVIMNQGNGADRSGPYTGNGATLDLGGTQPAVYTIPSISSSFADGQKLTAAGSRAIVDSRFETRTDYNVIAEKTGANDANVVMAGAHLDSVPAGPGINDNGSGSAALLETALLMAKSDHQNTIRFGWWAAEELGLLGSRDYVAGLSAAERDRIALYMNYDMVGSSNGYLGVYDADTSTFPAPAGVPIPDGSEAIEDLYESYYTSVGQPYDDSEYSGRSDYQAFIQNGIPSGGLFTGAEVRKTPLQAETWGGTADASFDPCYHQACDTYANNNDKFLEVNSDLIAFAMLTFAQSTESVNGVPGAPVDGKAFPLPAPAGEEGTFKTNAGGGGLAHDHDHDHVGEPS
jgi:Zn-dependent M28 family amino/carboxypeptidase